MYAASASRRPRAAVVVLSSAARTNAETAPSASPRSMIRCATRPAVGRRLVGAGRRRRQMPCLPLLVVVQCVGQDEVGVAAFLVGGHRDDRRPDQWMPERDPGGRVVDVHQLRAFGRGEVAEAGLLAGHLPEHTDVAGSLEGGDEQQPAGRFRQVRDARGEQGVEPSLRGTTSGCSTQCAEVPVRVAGSSTSASGLPWARSSSRCRVRGGRWGNRASTRCSDA